MNAFYNYESSSIQTETSIFIEVALTGCGISTSNLVYVDVWSLNTSDKEGTATVTTWTVRMMYSLAATNSRRKTRTSLIRNSGSLNLVIKLADDEKAHIAYLNYLASKGDLFVCW